MGYTELLYVCSYNLIRGPVAECITNQLAREQNLPLRAQSAGILTPEKGFNTELMSEALIKLGYEPISFQPRQITTDLVASSLTLCFEDWHLTTVKLLNHDLLNKRAYTIHEYTGTKYQIVDPGYYINTNRHPILGSLPAPLPRFFRAVDPYNHDQITELHIWTAKRIERLVKLTLKRMAAEELLPFQVTS